MYRAFRLAEHTNTHAHTNAPTTTNQDVDGAHFSYNQRLVALFVLLGARFWRRAEARANVPSGRPQEEGAVRVGGEQGEEEIMSLGSRLNVCSFLSRGGGKKSVCCPLEQNAPRALLRAWLSQSNARRN